MAAKDHGRFEWRVDSLRCNACPAIREGLKSPPLS
jgi:hypothetical protein